MKSLFTFLAKSRDFTDLGGWRLRVLDGILRGIFFVWLLALASGIYNVLEAYHEETGFYEKPLLIATSVISIYVGTTVILAFITFNRKLEFKLRAGLLLFIFYALGVIGMALSSFSGDGRIFFFAFIILTAVLFDLRYSLFAFFFTFLTMVVLGYLEVSGILVVPAESQVNSTDTSAWISGGIILLALSISALVSITYLLQALEKSLTETRQSLERQQRLGRILRTVSDINQLIVHERNPKKLLEAACRFLISGRGYAFSWIGLLEPDHVTLKLAAYAGDAVDESKFNVRLDQEDHGLICVENALRSRSYFRVEPSDEGDDPCFSCPRRLQYPKRSAAAFPLLREDRTLGVLVVDYNTPVTFDEEEIHLLQELANDIAFALEKLETDRQLETKARYQDLLARITRTALEIPDLAAMLQEVAEQLKESIYADDCYIVLWNDSDRVPTPIAATGTLRDIFLQTQADNEEIQIALNLFQETQTLTLDDAGNDPRVSPRIAELFSIRSLLGLSLIADDRRHGGIFLVFNQPHHFTPEEVVFGKQAAAQIALAVAKAHLYSKTRANAIELGKLYAAAQDMASSIIDPPALLAKLARHMTEALDCTSGYIISIDHVNSNLTVLAEYVSDDAIPLENKSDLGRVYSFDGYSTVIQAMFAGKPLVIHPDDNYLTEEERKQFLDYGVQSMLFIPIMSHGKLIGDAEIWESRKRREFSLADIRLAEAMAGHAASIIENSRLFEALEQREAYFRAVVENSAEGVAILDAEGNILYIAPAEERLTGYAVEEAVGFSVFRYIHPEDLPRLQNVFMDAIQKPGTVMTLEYRLLHKNGEWHHYEVTGHNMLNDPHVAGVVINYRDITNRKLAAETLRHRAEELEILTAISSMLRAAPNVGEMIPILTREAVKVIGGSYGSIFLLEPENGDLVSHGWYSAKDDLQKLHPVEYVLRHKLGEGITGYVAETGEIHITEDFQFDPIAAILPYEEERLRDVRSGVSLPLRAQDHVIGVLHVWLTEHRTFSENEIRLLTAVSEIAGNAIHRATLHEQTLRHANELAMAYDHTLAGWARALELRDDLTEGHTRRVTDLTVELARALGVPEHEMIHIRRGALLHDIGKMGIPDSILHKPGPLSEKEMKLMHLHPLYAYDMLNPISFLRPALDIPYCHHEKWDGTGYPRGLKGDEIPLASRIFSVVDVWDALTSDRPYRPAWTKEKARRYLIERSGTSFDPKIVKTFLSLGLD